MLDAVVISDLHLGSFVCRADRLEEFLKTLPKTKRLILNGDVLDSTSARLKKHHWGVLSLLRKLSDQLELVWVEGNHDRDAGLIAGLVGASFVPEYLFPSGNKKVLCCHGDQWDDFIRERPLVTGLAVGAYGLLRLFGRKVAIAVKQNSKMFLRCCDKVRFGAVAYAQNAIVLCGHTHLPESHPDVGYFNSGCWTETPHYLTVSDGHVNLHEYHDE